MNYKPYTQECWEIINTQIEIAKNENVMTGQKLVAAFDADGTLWDCDVGENFFHYQIENQLVELPDQPFEFYLNLKKKDNDPREAYMWLAQISKNKSLTEIQSWGKAAFENINPSPLFNDQKKLIQLLQSHEVEIFVVTASVSVAVQHGASLFGISPDHVLGVETVLSNGIITAEPILPITYKQGKVDALLKKTNGRIPFLCSGNTMGDFELLNCATHVRLAVSAASSDDAIYRTEMELNSIAKKNNWLTHRFI